jgi:hypothetical protein
MEVPVPCPYCNKEALASPGLMEAFTCPACRKGFYASTARCRNHVGRRYNDSDKYWRIEGVAASGVHHLFEFQGDGRLYVRPGHIFTVTYKLGFRNRPKPRRFHNHTLGQSWGLGHSNVRTQLRGE